MATVRQQNASSGSSRLLIARDPVNLPQSGRLVQVAVRMEVSRTEKVRASAQVQPAVEPGRGSVRSARRGSLADVRVPTAPPGLDAWPVVERQGIDWESGPE
jgi:hypothetical protein